MTGFNHRTLFLSLAAATLLAACGSPSQGGCASNSQCKAGRVCSAGQCIDADEGQDSGFVAADGGTTADGGQPADAGADWSALVADACTRGSACLGSGYAQECISNNGNLAQTKGVACASATVDFYDCLAGLSCASLGGSYYWDWSSRTCSDPCATESAKLWALCLSAHHCGQ